MIAYEVEPGMPVLVFSMPECGHCGEAVEMDDGVVWCSNCRVQWNRIEDGEASVPDPDEDGSDVPCAIVPQRTKGDAFDLVYGPCILPSGHLGDHECGFSRELRESGDPS